MIGFVLQIDAPDAAMGRHVEFRDYTLDGFRRAIAQRVEILNHALDGIPEEQIRYHVCWGNYEGPHTHDVPLRDIVDLVGPALTAEEQRELMRLTEKLRASVLGR